MFCRIFYILLTISLLSLGSLAYAKGYSNSHSLSFAERNEIDKDFYKSLQEINLSDLSSEEGKGILFKSFDFFDDENKENSLNILKKGNTLNHSILYKSAKSLNEEEFFILKNITPLSSFQNEREENGVNLPDLSGESSEFSNLKVSIIKSAYFIPYAKAKMFTPKLMSSKDYQKNCFPGIDKGKIKIIDVEAKDTFRIEKELVKILFKSFYMTIQMKISLITGDDLYTKISHLDGLPLVESEDQILLLERTKRHIKVQDGNRVVKTLLIYRQLEGGVLVTSYSLVLNDSIPLALAPVLNYFGEKDALRESHDTVILTRKFFKSSSF